MIRMAVKEVYSIRISKSDNAIKNYLEQFPVKEQTQALKTLLKYGVERLQENYFYDKAFLDLKDSIKHLQNAQEEKLNEIHQILTELQVSGASCSKEDSDEPLIDNEKARKSMEEALSMLLG